MLKYSAVQFLISYSLFCQYSHCWLFAPVHGFKYCLQGYKAQHSFCRSPSPITADNCLPYISVWTWNTHLELKILETKLLSFLPESAPSSVFLTSENWQVFLLLSIYILKLSLTLLFDSVNVLASLLVSTIKIYVESQHVSLWLAPISLPKKTTP